MTYSTTMATKTKTGFKLGRSSVPAFIAMLSCAVLTILLLPAYGQQEVDPTWYDPWTPNGAVTHVEQPATAVQLSQVSASTQKARSVSPAAYALNAQGKSVAMDYSGHHAVASVETPSADRLASTGRVAKSKTRAAKTRLAAFAPESAAAKAE